MKLSTWIDTNHPDLDWCLGENLEVIYDGEITPKDSIKIGEIHVYFRGCTDITSAFTEKEIARIATHVAGQLSKEMSA